MGSGKATPSVSQARPGCTGLLSPPSSSMAVSNGPCLLTLRKGYMLSKPSSWENFYTSPTWSTRPTTWCGTRSTSLWIHRNLFCNCWETETGMVRACHTPRQPLQNHPSGTLWWVGDAMDNIKEWTSLPMPKLLTAASCRKKNGRGSLLNRLSCFPSLPPPPRATTQSVKGLDGTELGHSAHSVADSLL